MVRRFQPGRSLPREALTGLVTLAAHAPSAGFSQGWHFLVLDESDAVNGYWAATTEPGRTDDPWLQGMRTAPALIVVFSDRSAYERRYARLDKVRRADVSTDLDQRWPVPYWHLDTAMAALLILLGAVDAGLGSCFFGVPTDRVDAVRIRFGVPGDLVPVGTIALGYPDPDYHATRSVSRRPLPDVVSYGSFGSPA